MNESPSIESSAPPEEPHRRAGSHAGWLIALALALVGSNAFWFWKSDRQREDLRHEISALQESVAGELASLRLATSAKARESEETLREQLEAARRHAAAAVGKAKTEALRHAEELSQRLAAETKRQQDEMAQQVAGELTGLKEANTTASARMSEVSGEVQTVKTELGSAISELRSVKGDLGVQSGLIATNGKELAALKARGERNYYEFNLTKTKLPQSVGPIRLALGKADPKRSKYTVTVLADDKRIEKKDKTANEPVQFYAMGVRTPYELVVNEVQKDRIVGYLATPKAVDIASR